MVRIRLTRTGLKKQASYRIVVTDKRQARDADSLETIGWYNPRTRPQTEIIDEARALYWLSVGAQPSESMVKILNRLGTLERLERLKAGESIEALVAEAEAKKQPLPSQKTNYPAPEQGQSWVKAREAAKKG
jgi:small subunit ribosomal protein S16